MKRQDLKGFTFKGFGVCVEFVFYKFMPRVVAIYRKDNKTLIKRFEI